MGNVLDYSVWGDRIVIELHKEFLNRALVFVREGGRGNDVARADGGG